MSEKAKPYDDVPEKEPVLVKKNEWSEFAKTAVLAVCLALLIRAFLYEPFNIPSGSMKPTLLVGDYLFVYKPAYGYSRYSFPLGVAPIQGRVWAKDPERGDIVVFKLPTNPSIDYIKRVIGLPGDRIQVTKGRLYINGEQVERRRIGEREVSEGTEKPVLLTEYVETLPNGVVHSIYEESDEEPYDNTEEFVVPKGHYFMMGDNRDHSQDSRVQALVGFVPFENFVGKADFLFFSTNGNAWFWEVWKWPFAIRFERLFTDLEPEKK